jgi:calcineurin-like phosphoesterase family protein
MAGAPRAPLARERRLAIGDPQAPLERLLDILDAHGALGDDGRLVPDVHLVSIGDHFDWGGRSEREIAAQSGLETLSWLAAHPSDQVTLILGNHDLGRVGEMAAFDDEAFRRAQDAADSIHWALVRDPEAERRFLERHPQLPSAEAAARDFATFRVAQRDRVASLLRARRFCAATASSSLLLCHAGVTTDDLAAIGLARADHADAVAVAGALNAALDAAVDNWSDGVPLSIPFLHQPGNAVRGEGRGIFYQRPSNADTDARRDHFVGPPRRRFDPRGLPAGLVQAVGHIRDGKCRALLRPWVADGRRRVVGRLRHLHVHGEDVSYRAGLPTRTHRSDATLLFLDGGMNQSAPEAYEMLDVDRVAVAPRRSS